MEGKVCIIVAGVNLDGSIAAVLSVDIGACRNAPSGNIGASSTPDVAGKGCDIGGGTYSGLYTIVDIDITGLGRSFPVQGRVQSVKAIEASITKGNL